MAESFALAYTVAVLAARVKAAQEEEERRRKAET
jgi:hypothetical protein